MKYAATADWATDKQYSVTLMCAQLGVDAKSHMSAIAEEDAARVLQAIKNRTARPMSSGVTSATRKPSMSLSYMSSSMSTPVSLAPVSSATVSATRERVTGR